MSFTPILMPSPAGGAVKWAVIAERVFLWVPGGEKPGLPAFLVCLVRETVFPIVLIGSAIAAAAPFAKVSPDSLAGHVLGLGAFAVFEELARYAFGRKARSVVRAIILFTVLTILVETVTYWRSGQALVWNLETRAGSWVVHLVGGLALWSGFTRRWAMAPLVAALVVLHGAYNIATVEMGLGVTQAVKAGAEARGVGNIQGCHGESRMCR